MGGKTKTNFYVQWAWAWIARERKRRGIRRSEFARSIGIRRETLYRLEEGLSGSAAVTLLEALDRLGALGTVAEIGDMRWHGAVLSLTKREAKRYDAIAKARGVTRAEAIRRLAAKGLEAEDGPESDGD